MSEENVEIAATGSENVSSVDSAVENTNLGTTDAREFTDNDLVRVPWSKEPIKHGELYKRLQADHTKKTTEAANLRRQYERDRAEWTRSKQAEETRLKQLATELLAQRRGNGQGQVDPFAKLEGVQFVDGKTAAQLFRDLHENGLGGIHNAIRERDAVIETLAGQMQRLQRAFQQVSGTVAGSGFESKIDGFLKAQGLSDKYKQFAKELYMAYEGDDLDEQFPQILRERVDGLKAMWEEEQNQRVESARKRPFPFPGKGGTGTTSKKLALTGRENARQTADVVWEAMQGGDDT